MIVNRKSWHYRYNAWLYGESKMDRIGNGCEYFWRTVLVCALSPLIGIMALGIVVHNIMPSLPKVNMPTISDDTKDRIASLLGSFSLVGILFATILGCEINPWAVAKVYAIIAGVIGLGFLCILIAIRIQNWYEKRPRKAPKEKAPNMAWQMVKAKKAKYCPKLVITN